MMQKQKEFFGFNSINKLALILKNHKPKSIFLVTGQSSYEKSGAKQAIEKILEGFKVIKFDKFEENPKLEDIKKGVQLFKKSKCDFVIAIGGGSAIDVAKSINIISSNKINPTNLIKKNLIKKKGKPLAAIPTTSGSGSEATQFAVVYINKTKYSLDHYYVIPDYTILDYKLTLSLPKSITASSGMDALSQAIESYWSVNSTEESKEYSKKAIKLIMDNLTGNVNNPSEKSRESMLMASHLAGKAINIARTTACHSISYPITTYFNAAHGNAVALTLGSFIEYNHNVTKNDVLDKRGMKYVKKTIDEIIEMIGARSAADAKTKIENLMKQIGLSTRLSELGIKTNNDILLIVKNGFNPQRVKNNPRRLTENKLISLLNAIR